MLHNATHNLPPPTRSEGRGATYGNTHSIYGLYTHIGRVVCMYLHLFLGWHTNRFFAHSSHGDVVVVVVMLPFFFLFAIVYALSNKRTNTHTQLHAYTQACWYVSPCVVVCVYVCHRTRRARNSKKWKAKAKRWHTLNLIWANKKTPTYTHTQAHRIAGHTHTHR